MIIISLVKSAIEASMGRGANYGISVGGQKITNAGIEFDDFSFGNIKESERTTLKTAMAAGYVSVTSDGYTVTDIDEVENVSRATSEQSVAEESIMDLLTVQGISKFQIKSAYEEVTIAVGEGLIGSGGAVLTSETLLPANSYLLGSAVTVITAPGGGATTLDAGRDSKAAAELVDGFDVTAGGKITSWEHATPVGFAAVGSSAEKIEVSTDADVTVSDMVVRVEVFYAVIA